MPAHPLPPMPNNKLSATAAKRTWHRPTVTFVPLTATANTAGSGPDGGVSEAGGAIIPF